MTKYEIPFDILERIKDLRELTPEEFQTLILEDPQNVQIEMAPDASGIFVPIDIYYSFRID